MTGARSPAPARGHDGREVGGAARARRRRIACLAGLAGAAGALILLAAAGWPRGQGAEPLATAPADTSSLAPTPGVRDPVFAVLLGFMLDHHTGRIDGDRIRTAVESTGRRTSIPYGMIRSLASQALVPAGGDPPAGRAGTPVEARVDLLLDRDLDLPVPYKILVYHPGSFQGSSHLVLRDLDLGRQVIPHQVMEDKKEVSRPFTIEGVRFCILEEGRLLIDVDGWVDALAGDKIDDTSTAALVVYRREGMLYGLALGYNRRGEPRSGTLSFAEDRVLVPGPPEVRSVTRQMRKILEAYVPSIRERFKGW